MSFARTQRVVRVINPDRMAEMLLYQDFSATSKQKSNKKIKEGIHSLKKIHGERTSGVNLRVQASITMYYSIHTHSHTMVVGTIYR